MLKQANPEDRAALYAEFGLTLRYDPTDHQIKVTAELSRVRPWCRRTDSKLSSTPPRGR